MMDTPEKILEYITGEEARTSTADAMERVLFKMLIEMGLKLLGLFFEMRSQNANRDTPREYVSIFGKVRFVRPYFYRSGQDGQTLLVTPFP